MVERGSKGDCARRDGAQRARYGGSEGQGGRSSEKAPHVASSLKLRRRLAQL